MRLFKKITALAVAMTLTGCSTSYVHADDAVSQTRDVSGFDEIVSNSSGDVEVVVGGAFSIRVKAHEDSLEYISTEVEDGALVVSREGLNGRRSSRFINGYTVYVTMPSLDAFTNRGSGDGKITGLSADDFELRQNGSGDMEISGTCKNGDFISRGSGDLDARDLTCDEVKIASRGSGDVEMAVNGAVSIKLNGSGDVDLYGSPKITHMSSRGSGDLTIVE